MEGGARVVGVGRKYQYLCADHYAEWKPFDNRLAVAQEQQRYPKFLLASEYHSLRQKGTLCIQLGRPDVDVGW